MNENTVSKRELNLAVFASLIGIATVFLPASCWAQGYTITTVAGGVSFSSVGCAQQTDSLGDGCPATSALVSVPYGVGVDAAGNLYIADTGDSVVRKVTPSGTITTVAGTAGAFGYSGDGGPATAAELSEPWAVTVDAAGNLYIADSVNGRIRKVSANGIITTFAGGGTGCAQQTDSVGDGCPATSASLASALSVAVDAAGHVYIGTSDRVRKVAADGIMTTVAGSGLCCNYPLGDGGPATSAEVVLPYGLTVDSGGVLYISEYQANIVRKVSPAGTITTVAGSGAGSYSGDGGPATSAGLYQPWGIAVDSSGNLYIADSGDQRIREVLANNGTIISIAGNSDMGDLGDGGPATKAELNGPSGVAVSAAGSVYVADTMNNVIRLLTPVAVSPAILPTGGLLNGASFQTGIVPGSWITIKGTNLSAVTDTWANAIVNGKLPTSLDNVKVSVGGEPAYISYVSPTQINAVAPKVATGPVSVAVTNSIGTSSPISTVVQPAQPAFFLWPGNYAVATTQDYSLAVKNGTFSVTTTPAKPGEVIILWGTGFGPTSPSAPAGVEVPSSTTYNTATSVTVTVGGTAATVYGAALAPGYAGLYQVAIQIPASLANGDYSVIATISGAQSPSTTLITVQN
jgi:uncharacterized protein (TIGR03437 family)